MRKSSKPQGIPGQLDAAGRKLFSDNCPARYTGPIERADGTRPYNGYLWPTERWWAYYEPGKRNWDSQIRFGIVALADGRWAVNGFLWSIEKDDRRYSWPKSVEQLVKHNCFATRAQAVRTAAADTLRLLRSARRWENNQLARDPVHWAAAVNWVLETAHREADGDAPALTLHRDPPPLKPVLTGMPLFDAPLVAQH